MSLSVLLYNPSNNTIYSKIGTLRQHNMGLAYVAASIEEKGRRVWILDADLDGVEAAAGLLDFIDRNRINVIGISATTPLINSALRTLRFLKQNREQLITVVGGAHATHSPEQVCKNKEVDFVVIGEGEVTINELLEAVETGSDLNAVKGIAFKKNGRATVTPGREPVSDLDSLPFPARHLFRNNQYVYPNSLYKNIFPIHTSRGCPAKCKFCLAQHRVRFRSAKSVVDEIESLIRKYDAEEFHVFDDNFAADKNRVFSIRDELKKRDLKPAISFTSGIRVDTAVDEEVLRAMREMGGYSVAFGIESGSQRILDSIDKGITLDQTRRAVRTAKRLGFEIWGFFMFGFPEETAADISTTIDFAMELNPHIAKFHILKPFPGSKVYSEIRENGLLDDDNFDNYSIHTYPAHHTKHLSREALNALHKTAYRKFYFRPGAFYNQLLMLRSFSRLKNNFKAALGVIALIFSK